MDKINCTNANSSTGLSSQSSSHFNMWNPKPTQKAALKMWYNEILRQHALVNLVPSDAVNILDMGCGQGYTTCRLVKKGRKINAVDIDSKVLSTWSDKAEKYGIKVHCQNLFDYNENEYDFVLTQEVIEHIPEYEKAILKGVELLKKDGQILICVPYKENLSAKSVYDPQTGLLVNKIGHLHSFTVDMLKQTLLKSNAKPIRITYHSNKRLVKWLVFLNLPCNNWMLTLDKIMNFLFTNKAAYIAVIAQKQ